MEGSRDTRFMSLALRLARRGQGWTSPNPSVGAVAVRGNRVVGRGYHRRAGAAHAEVEALRQAGARARGATLYVTLEPCNHYGRTPPCCDTILAAGVTRVVIAGRDPNPITNGRGIHRLRRAGVRVTTGVLAAEARRLNEPFHKAMVERLPFVIAKVGQSLDGKIATTSGASRWITSPASRRMAHAWRRRADAILVGVTTVLRDNPRLTVRGQARRTDRPMRVIVDSRLRTPLTARCLSQSGPPTVLATTTAAARVRRAAFARRGVEVLTFSSRRGCVPLRALCRALVQRGVQSILIEGGGEVLASAFEERLVDRIVFFIAPVLIGGRHAPTSLSGEGISTLAQAIRLADVRVARVGADLCVEARVVYPRRDRRRGTRDRT